MPGREVECPICGKPGKLYERKVGDRIYVYVRHTEGGKVWWCYLRSGSYDMGRYIKLTDRIVKAFAEDCLSGAGQSDWCRDARASLAYLYRRIRWLAARDRDLEALLKLPPTEEAPQA